MLGSRARSGRYFQNVVSLATQSIQNSTTHTVVALIDHWSKRLKPTHAEAASTAPSSATNQ